MSYTEGWGFDSLQGHKLSGGAMRRSEDDYAEMSAAVEAGEYIVGSDDRRDFRRSRSSPETPRHLARIPLPPSGGRGMRGKHHL